MAWADSSAGMMPSTLVVSWKASSASSSRWEHIRRGRCRAASYARPDTRIVERPAEMECPSRGSARPRSAADRCGCHAARRALPAFHGGAVLGAVEPEARGFDATIFTCLSSRKGWNRPMALEPPAGRRPTMTSEPPFLLQHLARALLLADHRLEVAAPARDRAWRAGGGADQVIGVLDIGHHQSPAAPRSWRPSACRARADRLTSAPSSFMREDVGLCRSTSGGAHIDHAGIAEAGGNGETGARPPPCWPAPVSANDALLAMRLPAGSAQAIVDLVRAGVVQVSRLK